MFTLTSIPIIIKIDRSHSLNILLWANDLSSRELFGFHSSFTHLIFDLIDLLWILFTGNYTVCIIDLVHCRVLFVPASESK